MMMVNRTPGAYNDDISIHCKVRRADGKEDHFGPSTEMLCTLRNWHHDETTPSHEALFVWNEHLPPEILLRPLPTFPAKLRNRAVLPWSADKIIYRVSLTDVSKATVLVDSCRVLLSLPHHTTLEIDCLARNGCDLLGAALQSRLPPVRCVSTRRPSRHSHVFPSRCSQKEYDVDALTSACMRATAAQESFTDKLERRWGKAVHDLGALMERTAEV